MPGLTRSLAVMVAAAARSGCSKDPSRSAAANITEAGASLQQGKIPRKHTTVYAPYMTVLERIPIAGVKVGDGCTWPTFNQIIHDYQKAHPKTPPGTGASLADWDLDACTGNVVVTVTPPSLNKPEKADTTTVRYKAPKVT
jgi:hypothetical protein